MKKIITPKSWGHNSVPLKQFQRYTIILESGDTIVYPHTNQYPTLICWWIVNIFPLFLSSLICQSAVQVGFVDPNSFNTISLSAVLKPLENQSKFTCYTHIYIYIHIYHIYHIYLRGCGCMAVTVWLFVSLPPNIYSWWYPHRQRSEKHPYVHLL